MPVAQSDEWTGRDVTVAEIERELARLREAVGSEDNEPDLRTNVLNAVSWAPHEWVDAVRRTLAGLDERHPSRTIVLTPDPTADDALDVDLSVRCFPLPGQNRHVCTEVLELRLAGSRADAPASIVTPLLIADLPVFLRWRGRPPFGEASFEQLVGIADRLIVDSAEWGADELPASYRALASVFERAAVSDLAWARAHDWRVALAARWPAIADVRTIRVAGPRADALLVAGWLRARLRREIEFVHDEADELELVAADGDAVTPAHTDHRSASDLVSDELEIFSRDPVYEDAVRAAIS